MRYREAFLAARDELVAELDGLDPGLKTVGAADQADRLPGKTARLVRAWPFRDVIAALDFVPVISGEQNDPADWAQWTDKAKQEAVITQFKNPLPAEGDADPEHTSPVAFLIVKSMLLTGFDAPVEQVHVPGPAHQGSRAAAGHRPRQPHRRTARTPGTSWTTTGWPRT